MVEFGEHFQFPAALGLPKPLPTYGTAGTFVQVEKVTGQPDELEHFLTLMYLPTSLFSCRLVYHCSERTSLDLLLEKNPHGKEHSAGREARAWEPSQGPQSLLPHLAN